VSWTVVFSSSWPHLVEIIKNLLDDNEIEFVVVDKRDSMYKSVTSPAIEVYIHSEDFIKTKNLLSDFETE